MNSNAPLGDARKLWSHTYGNLEGFLCISTAIRNLDDNGVPIKKGNNATREFTNKFFHYPEEEDEALAYVHKVNSVPLHEVWYSKTLFKSRRRGNDNVVGCGALAVELDGPRLPNGKLKPTAVVLSSPAHLNDDGKDHFHPSFAIDSSTPIDRAGELNRRLGKQIGGEKIELSGLLRIPGTINWKHPEEPVAELLYLDDSRRFDEHALDAILPEEEEREYTHPSSVGGGEPPVRLSGHALEVWEGKHPVLTDGGEIDRSSSLCKLAGVLWRANLQGAALRDALEERDSALGWEKYTGRPDADKRYWEIVEHVSSEEGSDAGGFISGPPGIKRSPGENNGQNTPYLSHIEGGGGFNSRTQSHPPEVGKKESEDTEGLKIIPLREVMEGEDEEVDFFVEDFIARGVCTLVVGKAKRSGKTTFVCTALRAMPRGLLFCGKQTRPANVLYVTEQNPLTFRKAIRESGLKDDMDHVQVVFLSDVFHMSYEQTVNKHAAWCKWHGYDLMVLDTFMEVAKLKGSEENESGVIAERMRAARIAGQRENIGMVLVHHAGRSGTSPRGSSAFEGSVDIIGELSRPEGHHEKNDRKIEVYGRVDEWESVVQWIEGERYIRKGGNDLEFSAALEHVRTVMREVLGEEDSLTVKEVTEKNPDVSGGETRKVLQWLADKNPPELFKGKRTGARGRPADTYWRSRPESSFFNPGRVGGESENKIPNPSNPAYLSHTETEEFIPEGVYSETPEINSPASLPPNSSLMNITRIEISEEEYEEEERLSRMPRKNPKRRGV